ncbi:hypothetical protein [Kribbella aluminosa]|uniref:hypothetical protein n=1 Tax=Kribbella aluminosa TaxID=416017 RepID=UPI0031E1BC74
MRRLAHRDVRRPWAFDRRRSGRAVVMPGPGLVMVPAVMQVVPVMVPVMVVVSVLVQVSVQVSVPVPVLVQAAVQVLVLVVMRCPGVGLGGVVGRPRWGG